VARNRQRASERKERLHRENVPGPLDHASGEVDEAEAAIVRGAGGRPEPLEDEELERAAGDAGDGGDSGNGGGGAVATARREERPEGRGGPRFLAFLRACWAELQRVQWPDRRQVAQATAVVLGFVVVAGAFLGLADLVAEQIVDFIL
jgi:preprotein translocase SecE subunit